jgi:hypothetical protein
MRVSSRRGGRGLGRSTKKNAKCPHNPRERKLLSRQGHTFRLYCELCILTARSSGRQTRLPAASSKHFRKGRGTCGGEGRHAVRLTPVDTLSARAHACKQQQEVEEVKELPASARHASNIFRARTAPEKAKVENTGTQCVKRKTDALPPGHMTI